jgi:YHS domain-containing protein
MAFTISASSATANSSVALARFLRTCAGKEMPMQKDPVCGMDVDPASAAGKSDYNGKTYYFCAASCKEKFDANPSQYVK